MIEYNIIESIVQTLKTAQTLEKFINPKRDLFEGFPANEPKGSKNLIIVEPGILSILDTNFINKTEASRRFSLDCSVYVGYTQETEQESLKKFLEFVSLVSNAIDESTYISNNPLIKKVELLSIDKDFETERLLLRQAELKYQFTGLYNSGNL